MTKLCILAVDPGLFGALAFYFPTLTRSRPKPARRGRQCRRRNPRRAHRAGETRLRDRRACRVSPRARRRERVQIRLRLRHGPRRHRGPQRAVAPRHAGKVEATFRPGLGQGKISRAGATVLADAVRHLRPQERSRSQRSRFCSRAMPLKGWLSAAWALYDRVRHGRRLAFPGADAEYLEGRKAIRHGDREGVGRQRVRNNGRR